MPNQNEVFLSYLILSYCEHECTLCNSLFQTNELDKYTCELCAKSNRIQRERIASGNNLSKQADRMVSRCNQILRSNDIGDNVAIPIPSVDRGHGDTRNIIYLVTYFISDTEQYKLGTRHGLLNSTFPGNQFLPSTFHVLSEADVHSNTEISIREAAPLQSIGNGQGCAKCSCKTGYARKLVNM